MCLIHLLLYTAEILIRCRCKWGDWEDGRIGETVEVEIRTWGRGGRRGRNKLLTDNW